MAKIYYRKIVEGDINPATGAAWNINDVPERWRAEVYELLNGNNGN
jgi:hypothetical protein